MPPVAHENSSPPASHGLPVDEHGTRLSPEEAKAYARQLYTRNWEKTQIAALVGYSRQTIHNWAVGEHWDEQRAAKGMSTNEFATSIKWQLKRIQTEIKEIHDALESAGEKQRGQLLNERSSLLKDQYQILQSQKALHAAVDYGLYLEVFESISRHVVNSCTEDDAAIALDCLERALAEETKKREA